VPKIKVTLLSGEQREVVAAIGEPLMHALRDQTLDVEAICGGTASCATCHVYVDLARTFDIPEANEAEQCMLDGLVHQRPGSRLSCQVMVETCFDGLSVTIAPTET